MTWFVVEDTPVVLLFPMRRRVKSYVIVSHFNPKTDAGGATGGAVLLCGVMGLVHWCKKEEQGCEVGQPRHPTEISNGALRIIQKVPYKT